MESSKLVVKNSGISLTGEIEVAPDKSISHRSLIFAALGFGESKITGLLQGHDVLNTAKALELMGIDIERGFDEKINKPVWKVNGMGMYGLTQPKNVLDMGNSGTAARLLAGLVSSRDFTSFFIGDGSLTNRPMKRVFDPIKQIGGQVNARDDRFMPFSIIGAADPLPIDYEMKIASAQVKSAILLAALNIHGRTTIIEPNKCRDHTEIMMKYLGLNIDIEPYGDNGTKISYEGMQEYDAKDFEVPGDISSAAFIIVAALITKNSEITIKNVGINPLRDGIIKTLQEMNGDITLVNKRQVCGEEVADLLVKSSNLKGIKVPASRAPSMIDEYPILSIAAAFADGVTLMEGLEELKVKESNRLLMIAENLKACGVNVTMHDDSLEVQGGDFTKLDEPAKISTSHDHRIAMSFFVMGQMLDNGVEIDDTSMIATSFPDFLDIFARFQ